MHWKNPRKMRVYSMSMAPFAGRERNLFERIPLSGGTGHSKTSPRGKAPSRIPLRPIKAYGRLKGWLAQQTLSVQFLVASGLLVLTTATIAGFLIADLVIRNATNSRAASTALLVQRMIQPILQELETSGLMSTTAVKELDRI